MSEMKMPAAVQHMIDAINDGDTDAFVAAFTTDGTINDWGRVLSGENGLRQWARTDAIGANAEMTVITAVTHGATTRVRFGWSSEAFNGESSGVFEVANDLVRSFSILEADAERAE
ncbi:nuclear transport factor 2 family protein [Microbacterium sp. NC79]|uniref:nuclear transport factor 2 family protein n=1 Tax=Microbacterium sp. NC79 TaxID=2851009 RepID=UPI001C2BA6E0|nr:nuclear transport factor 2 family protein [Microbacterium sp. NC79]MBV0895551.1 nuclear transport factor 2 family protein [Microbacterium sp. NC79]